MIATIADAKAVEARYGGMTKAMCADPGFCAAVLVIVAQDPQVPAEAVDVIRRVHAAHSLGLRPRIVFDDTEV